MDNRDIISECGERNGRTTYCIKDAPGESMCFVVPVLAPDADGRRGENDGEEQGCAKGRGR